MIDSRQRGFSLIEMIVVIAILGIVFGISFRFIATVGQWYDQIGRQNRADEKALTAVTRLQREIRTLTSTVTASDTLFSFVNANGQTNTVEWVSPNLTWNNFTLADGVNAFSNTYYDATNGVTTNLNLIRRIGCYFRVTDGSAESEMDVNLFYPETGTVK